MIEGDTLEDGIYYKVCIKCGRKKVRGCFCKNDSYYDGFNVRCKLCSKVKKDTGKYRDVAFARAQRNRYGYAKI